jgi:hypothetical protein
MEQLTMWDQIYPWFVGAIGGAMGAAFLLPTKLGEAVIQYGTGKLLEGFKAEQYRELERLKERLNHLGDRGRRSNEMEFSAIETVWKGFVKAWLSTNTCVSAMIRMPDFNRMTDEEVKKFASSSGLSDSDQETLLKSSDRQDEYARLINWQNVIQAGKDIYQARLTLREQRIFMPPEITKQFSDVIERMSSVQVERQLAMQHKDAPDMFKTSAGWIRDCLPVFDDMAILANRRLFREERDIG